MRNQLTTAWEPDSSRSAASWDWDAQPTGRLVWLTVLFAAPLIVIGIRLVDVQVRLSERFTSVFAQTTTRYEDISTRDGRILGADGSILADDVIAFDVLVHYRWLEQPPDRQWLRRKAWERLSRSERRHPGMVAAQEDLVQERRHQLWRDLSRLTRQPPQELRQRADAIQERVERIWSSVAERWNTPRESQSTAKTDTVWWRRWQREFTEPPRRVSRSPLTIKEQEEHHIVAENVAREIAEEIIASPERFPGVKVATRSRRQYPQHDLAAHLLGTRTPVAAEPNQSLPADYRVGDLFGRNGLERQYDEVLHGRRGSRQVVLNRHGEILSRDIVLPPGFGKDLVLTLDPALQRQAEQLLDRALLHKPPAAIAEDEGQSPANAAPTGGCLIALDVQTGAVLAAAAAPRYDANLLVTPDNAAWQALLADPRKPLFPRATQMAIPPGSVFKVVSAAALLASQTLTTETRIDCRGYLDQPSQHRCLTFRHFGYGHGPTDLSEALCRSCNVYFYSGARRLGPERLVDWAERFGIGQPTGLDVPGEAGGYLPRPESDGRRRWFPGETLGLAIGQASLLVTPLQMARVMAAIANDGQLVTPHLVATAGPGAWSSEDEATARSIFGHAPPQPIAGLDASTLAAIREGLDMVVHDPRGTAYKTARLKEVRLAGKTGTAEVGGGRPDHAWFAGYVPSEQPRVAFAVVLEHGGSGGKVAGPIAREFVRSLLELGLISPPTNSLAGP